MAVAAVEVFRGSGSDTPTGKSLRFLPAPAAPLIPALVWGGGIQEHRATNEEKDPVPQTDCVTHLRPEPVASIRIIPLVFALRSLMERRGSDGHQKTPTNWGTV